jgi:molybdopterin-binding protein
VTATGLVRSRGGATLLSVDELELAPGRVHVVVGPNGAGKTTLLRIIGGIERPDAGEVRVLGRDIWRSPRDEALAVRRRLGFAAQRPYLFRSTVRRNVEYPLRVRGVGRDERARRAREAMEDLGVLAFAERSARTLSAGEQVRVSIARAIVAEPELLLLDEPLASIDPEARPFIEMLVLDLASRGGTVVVATHVLERAYRLSADVVRLEAGRLAPPAVENLLEGELVPGEDEAEAMLVLGGGCRICVSTERRGRARASIEPRDIVVSREPFRSSARNSLPGRVAKLEDRGGVVRVTADVGVPLVSTVTHESVRELGLSVGSDVLFTFKATAIKVF